jgi:hypothetical protein
MARHKQEKPSAKPPLPRFPQVVVNLARAFRAGEECGFALHDALLEAGEPELAAHFQGPCTASKRCVVVEYLVSPRWFQARVNKPHPSELRFCLDLHMQGAFTVSAEYHGAAGTGSVENNVIQGADGEESTVEWDTFVTVRGYQAYHGLACCMEHVIDALVLHYCPRGYENNEGGHGTFTFNVQEGTGVLDHTWHEYIEHNPADEDYEIDAVDAGTYTRQFDFFRPKHFR